MARLTLVRRVAHDELPLRAPELRERLRVEAANVATMAESWAAREEPVSFKDFEIALRDLVFAFARIAIMLSRATRGARDAVVPERGRARRSQVPSRAGDREEPHDAVRCRPLRANVHAPDRLSRSIWVSST